MMSQEETACTPLRIAVLLGGDSSEREVSLDSGHCVAEALARRGHRVEFVDPAAVALEQISSEIEIILPMLHGTGAEDGSLQLRLDRLGIPWLGSSAESSRLTFDKIAARAVLAAAGLPIAPGIALHAAMSADAIARASDQIGFPQVVKPAAQGSSIGVSIVHNTAELRAAQESALQWGSSFLIEQFIAGREVTVPVIDGCVFPAVEILPSREWYDYSAKYSDDATGYRVAPANLPRNLNQIVRSACEVCGVSAISRTDLRIDAEGRCSILEINTIPGMTSHSLVPMSAAALGITVGELCETLLLKKLGRIQTARWEDPNNSIRAAA